MTSFVRWVTDRIGLELVLVRLRKRWRDDKSRKTAYTHLAVLAAELSVGASAGGFREDAAMLGRLSQTLAAMGDAPTTGAAVGELRARSRAA